MQVDLWIPVAGPDRSQMYYDSTDFCAFSSSLLIRKACGPQLGPIRGLAGHALVPDYGLLHGHAFIETLVIGEQFAYHDLIQPSSGRIPVLAFTAALCWYLVFSGSHFARLRSDAVPAASKAVDVA